jgi:2-oxoisovalerate dehydrogenase E2 component (dihydrolipoyl transacylase)
MALTVIMPQLGESVTEGTIAKWLKQPGDAIERYESIAEVITDKVNAEIPAPADGIMGQHMVEEGAVVPVGQPICTIEEASGGAASNGAAKAQVPAEAAPAQPQQEPAAQAPAAAQAPPAAAPIAVESAGAPPSQRAGGAAPPSSPASQPPAPAQPVPQPGAGAPAAQHVTPAVRMLAREHGVDLGEISGSGIGGRVTKKDVLEFVQRRDSGQAAGQRARPEAPVAAPSPAEAQAAPPPAAATPTPAVAATATPGQGDTVVPLTPMRRAIAEHMVRSRQTSPHAWLMMEVDMTAVARVRSSRRADFQQRTGVDLTFLPFVARAVVAALQQYPTLNSSWSADGIVLRRAVNLGFAVALEDGLIVPVVHNAERLNLEGLALATTDVIDRARNKKLRVDDVQGGTFTLNNAGALGTVMSQAIINQPQAAIMVMDAIVKRPVVVGDDGIAVRSMMNLSLSFDHRINDGLQGARFLRACKEALEGIEENSALL